MNIPPIPHCTRFHGITPLYVLIGEFRETDPVPMIVILIYVVQNHCSEYYLKSFNCRL